MKLLPTKNPDIPSEADNRKSWKYYARRNEYFRLLLSTRKPYENLRDTHTPVLKLKLWPAHRRHYAMHLYWVRDSIWGGGRGVCRTLPVMLGLPAWLRTTNKTKNLKWDIDLKRRLKCTKVPHPDTAAIPDIYFVFQNECDYYIALCSSEKMSCIENANACENRTRANGKQCMMQMPVRTAEQLYRDDSHFVPQSICDSVLWNDPVFIMKWPSL